jgi:hypothetical protein
VHVEAPAEDQELLAQTWHCMLPPADHEPAEQGWHVWVAGINPDPAGHDTTFELDVHVVAPAVLVVPVGQAT